MVAAGRLWSGIRYNFYVREPPRLSFRQSRILAGVRKSMRALAKSLSRQYSLSSAENLPVSASSMWPELNKSSAAWKGSGRCPCQKLVMLNESNDHGTNWTSKGDHTCFHEQRLIKQAQSTAALILLAADPIPKNAFQYIPTADDMGQTQKTDHIW